MEENKKEARKIILQLFLPELLTVLAGAGFMTLILWLRRENEALILQRVLFTVLGIAVSGFQFRREYLENHLDYDNGEHPLRFYISFFICMAAAFACGFLPAEGWPFPVIYVMLTLFGNMSVGILSASVLLMISVLIGVGDFNCFFLYFISGIFAASLFQNLKEEFKIGKSLFLSMLCLLLCETASVVLTVNARPDFEMFVVPAANLIVSSVLLVGGLKLFSSAVVYKYREAYLELNDTENPMLTELKSASRGDYFQSVHTAYFCERIAAELNLDADALKCAGYYHKLGDALPGLLEEGRFPPKVKVILTEYLDKNALPRQKETAVLLCCDSVVASVVFLLNQGGEKTPDYDKVIDVVFKRLLDAGTFNKCNISMKELRMMQKKFKEEKLYYDFLR